LFKVLIELLKELLALPIPIDNYHSH